MPGEDFHLSVVAPLQAHWGGRRSAALLFACQHKSSRGRTAAALVRRRRRRVPRGRSRESDERSESYRGSRSFASATTYVTTASAAAARDTSSGAMRSIVSAGV